MDFVQIKQKCLVIEKLEIKKFSIQTNIRITNIEVKLIGDNLMVVYKVNLMNSKPHLMNLTSCFMGNINSFESNSKKL